MQLHGDLPVAGDVRRDREPDTGLLELYRGLWPSPPGAGVDHADRSLLTHEDVGLAVVERRDDRLGLDVGQVLPLQRAQERGQREAAEGGGEDQVERRAHDGAAGVADGRDRVAAQVHDVHIGVERLAGTSGRCAGPAC